MSATRPDMTKNGWNSNGEYVAKYRWRDRFAITAITLFIFIAPFPPIFHFGKPFVVLCFIAGLMGTVVTYRSFFWMVTFRDDVIDVQIAPFLHYFEKYSEIVSWEKLTGIFRIYFHDGRSVSVQEGCGDFEEIAAILERKTTGGRRSQTGA